MNPFKIKRLKTIFFLYWFLLAYSIAALVWWLIALDRQNSIMTGYKLSALNKSDAAYHQQEQKILKEQNRKTFQYFGEGGTFLLLIIGGAIFVFRGLRTQFQQSRQQQDFMIAITHELKTPIAVTKLNLETLQKYNLEPEKRQKLLENTIQETNRLNALCNNMLLASQIEAGKYKLTLERIDLSQMVSDCIREFTNRFPVRKIISSVEKEIIVAGDMLMLQMAVNNILDNAIKYSGKDSAIKVAVQSEAETVKVRITDEGKGIPEEEKQKIFMKYYRGESVLAKKAKGTGLGLFLTKNIVKQHSGDIKVMNNVPVGSIFEIYLSKY